MVFDYYSIHYQLIYELTMDITPSDEPPRQTTKDKQYDSTLFLRAFASRLTDVCQELSRLSDHFSDRTTLDRSQISSIKSLRKTIIPYLSTQRPSPRAKLDF